MSASLPPHPQPGVNAVLAAILGAGGEIVDLSTGSVVRASDTPPPDAKEQP